MTSSEAHFQPKFVDPSLLLACLGQIPTHFWSNSSKFRVGDVHHGYRRATLIMHGRRSGAADPFEKVLEPFQPVREAFVSSLDPGGFIIPHWDEGPPWFERWHLPIQASGWFDDFQPRSGEPFLVRHWEPHAVWNDGTVARIHLVIDRDVLAPTNNVTPRGLQTFPIPAKFQHLIDATSG